MSSLPAPTPCSSSAAPSLRWGILGTGRITEDFCTALFAHKQCVLQAVGSRNLESANKFADIYNIPERHSCYESLVSSPTIDVVYIGSPDTLHDQHALLALQHNKHVLLEKPFTQDKHMAQTIIKLAREKNLFLQEAMWSRFIPSISYVFDLVSSGVLGEIRTFQCDFCCAFNIPSGSLMSIGVYNVHISNLLFNSAPTVIHASGSVNAAHIDTQMAITMQYQPDQLHSSTCSLLVNSPRHATICGTKGHVIIEGPFWHAGSKLRVQIGDEKEQIVDFEDQEKEWKYVRPFNFANSHRLVYQAFHVQECISRGLSESPLVPLDSSLLTMSCLDELRRQLGVNLQGPAHMWNMRTPHNPPPPPPSPPNVPPPRLEPASRTDDDNDENDDQLCSFRSPANAAPTLTLDTDTHDGPPSPNSSSSQASNTLGIRRYHTQASTIDMGQINMNPTSPIHHHRASSTSLPLSSLLQFNPSFVGLASPLSVSDAAVQSWGNTLRISSSPQWKELNGRYVYEITRPSNLTHLAFHDDHSIQHTLAWHVTYVVREGLNVNCRPMLNITMKGFSLSYNGLFFNTPNQTNCVHLNSFNKAIERLKHTNSGGVMFGALIPVSTKAVDESSYDKYAHNGNRPAPLDTHKNKTMYCGGNREEYFVYAASECIPLYLILTPEVHHKQDTREQLMELINKYYIKPLVV